MPWVKSQAAACQLVSSPSVRLVGWKLRKSPAIARALPNKQQDCLPAHSEPGGSVSSNSNSCIALTSTTVTTAPMWISNVPTLPPLPCACKSKYHPPGPPGSRAQTSQHALSTDPLIIAILTHGLLTTAILPLPRATCACRCGGHGSWVPCKAGRSWHCSRPYSSSKTGLQRCATL